MAYPYFPGYTPYPPYQPNAFNSYQQMQQQSVVQNGTQQYSPFVNQNGIIWISGAQEAQMYPIAPNNAVALWEKSGKTIYLKQADATGKPSVTVYDLVERQEAQADGASLDGGKQQAYATKDELKAVVGALNGIDGVIASIKGEIDKMSGDLYGIAGKKKSVKKQEVATDDDE